jgi:hypothetical protein
MAMEHRQESTRNGRWDKRHRTIHEDDQVTAAVQRDPNPQAGEVSRHYISIITSLRDNAGSGQKQERGVDERPI